MSLNIKIVNNSTEEMEQLKKIYLDSFPMEERMPMWLLQRKTKKEYIHFLAVYDEQNLIGFTYLVLYRDITFVQYLVIDKIFSSKGYGSQVLSILKDRYPNTRIVLNIEAVDEAADNYEQRTRRKSFYVKNGFRNSKYVIIQFKFPYEVMVYGDDVTTEELSSLFRLFSGGLSYKLSRLRIVEYQTKN